MESGIDPRLALGAAEQQDALAQGRMAENLAQNGADDAAKRAKMRQACEGFESIFIQKMWEQMRATLPREGLMKSKEEEFWMSMYDQELAKSMTSAGGIGLADMMERQLSRNDANIGEASRVSPARRLELDVRPAPLLPSSGTNPEGKNAESSVSPAGAPVSGRPGPAGSFTGVAEAHSPLPSIYDGEAPTEATVENPAELPAELPAGAPSGMPAASPGAAPAVAAPAAAQVSPGTMPGTMAGIPAPASGSDIEDPIRQTLDELQHSVAAASPASRPGARVARGEAERDVHVSLASASNPRLTLQQMKGEAPTHASREASRAPTAMAPAPASSVPPAAVPNVGEAAVTAVGEQNPAPAAQTRIRVTYQTNLPPNQRNTSAEKMLLAMREAQRPAVARSISSGSPYEAAPARAAAPASVPAGESASPAPAPELPAAPVDPLAGIQPRFVPSRFSNPLYAARSEAANFAVAMTEAARPSIASLNATTVAMASARHASGLPDMIAAVQSGGPALAAPEMVHEAVSLGNPAPARGSLEAPVSGDISSGFGWRVDPFTGRRSWHAGVDIKASPGEAVRAARDGVVSFAGEHPELGNLVVVDHGDGLRTFYGHNRSLEVRVGQVVSAGTELAKAGASGRASGTHVHFEVRRGDLALNPEPLIRQGNMLLADAR